MRPTGAHGATPPDGLSIQRSLGQAVQRLEAAAERARDVQSLFAPELLALRTRVWTYAERLFRARPLALGATSLDLLWTRAIYAALGGARRLQAGWTPLERAYLQAHLWAAAAQLDHFLRLLERVEPERRVAAPAWADWQTATRARLYVYLGDLARYRLDFSPTAEADLARRYYSRALACRQDQGAPFNQLASLSRRLHHGLDAAFLYLRSLHSPEPFAGAEANLRRLLARPTREAPADLTVEPTAERAIRHHLALIRGLLFEAGATSDLAQTCQRSLTALQHYLHRPESRADPSDRACSEAVVHRLVLSLLILLEHSRLNDAQRAVVHAYLLALFTQIVTKIVGDLTLALWGPEAMLRAFDPAITAPSPPHAGTPAPSASDTSPVGGRPPGPRWGERRRRRAKALASGSDTDLSTSDEAELSEAKSVSPSPSDSSGTEFSDGDSVPASGSGLSDTEDEDVIIESSRSIVSTLDLVRLMKTHPLSGGFRILSQWLLGSKEVLSEASQSSELFWTRLVKFFNLISLQHPEYTPCQEVLAAVDRVQPHLPSFPQTCPEASLMAGMKFCQPQLTGQPSQSHLLVNPDDDNEDLANLTSLEKATLHILHLLSIRDRFCQNAMTGLQLMADDRVIHVPRGGQESLVEPASASEVPNCDLEGDSQDTNDVADGAKPEVIISKEKEEVMEQMAKLWLQQEVNDLEGRTTSLQGFAHYSPYLVLDHLALSSHLNLVKEIVLCRRFAVIVPTVVVQELDGLKKRSSGARNAIRWLEKEFGRGNRWLRSQRLEEFKVLELLTYPKKKKEREALYYFKILECANHFAHVRGKSSAANMIHVTVLSSKTRLESDGKDETEPQVPYDPRAVAQSLGIVVENIEEFIDENKVAKKKKRPKWIPKGGSKPS